MHKPYTTHFLQVMEDLLSKGLVRSRSELGARLGYENPNSSMSMIVKSGKNITPDKLERLYAEFNVSPEYIRNGSGPMYRQAQSAQVPGLQSFLELPAQPATPATGPGQPNLQILTVVVDNHNEERCVVVPEFALGGYSEGGYLSDSFIRDLPTESIPEDLRGRGTVRKFQVYGNSMEPTLCHGDYIYCTYADINHRNIFDKLRDNHIYVVATTQGLFVKRVFYHKDDDFIQLHSDAFTYTKDKKYAPFPFPLNEVREFWYFRRRYTAQAPPPTDESIEVNKLRREIFEVKSALSRLSSALRTGGNDESAIYLGE